MEFIFSLFVLLIIIVGASWQSANTTYRVSIKNELPYCLNCNRQVSYKRDHCRACGQQFKFYGPPPLTPEEEIAKKKQEEKIRQKEAILEDIRKQEQDEYYRSKGIEPGPWAWFYDLPEYVQPIVIGLAVGLPIVFIAVSIILARR